tara:strand:- start:468 stop:1181 length:714 start_codon:yes stop_codon:yes gene_type:complete
MDKKVLKHLFSKVKIILRGDVYQITLDDRVVRTPGGNNIYIPNYNLAKAIRSEWKAQKSKFCPTTMPMMQFACTVIDHVIPNRNQVISKVLNYAETDLLCYRCDTPLDLKALQDQSWQPFLDWSKEVLSAPLISVSGYRYIKQPDESLDVLRKNIENYNDWELLVISQMTQLMTSLILTLSVVNSYVDWRVAFQASVLEEEYQRKRWGEVPEAIKAQNSKFNELNHSVQFLKLLRSE